MAAVVSMRRLDEIRRLESDLQDAVLLLARLATDTGRHPESGGVQVRFTDATRLPRFWRGRSSQGRSSECTRRPSRARPASQSSDPGDGRTRLCSVPNRGAQGIVDGLAERLHRSVVVGDRNLHVLYSSRHFRDEDPVRVEAILNREANSRAIEYVLDQGVASWTSVGVIPPNPDLGMAARVCLPVRWHGELLAFVMVIDANGSVTTRERSALAKAGESLIPYLAAELMDTDLALDSLVHDLLSPAAEVRRTALASAPAGLAEDFRTVTAICLMARPGSHHGESALASVAMRRTLSLPTPTGVTRQLGAVEESSAVVLLGSHRSPSRRTLAEHALRMLARAQDPSVTPVELVAGLGPSVEGLGRAFDTAEAAGAAARAAFLGLRGTISAWDELGAYGPLLRIPASQLRLDIIPAELRLLLNVDRDRTLTSTLRTYLDVACSAHAAAEALLVHRTTLYYRLRRIEELTGLSLSDGQTRVALHVGLLLLDIIQATQREPRDAT